MLEVVQNFEDLMTTEAFGSGDTRKKRIRKALLDSEETELVVPVSAAGPSTAKAPENASASSKRHGEKTNANAARSRGIPNTDKDLEMYAYNLVNHMRSCFKEDQRLNEQNKPAFVKIENIEAICTRIMRKDAREALLKMGVLSELRTWLEPLPDNSLPNPKVKKWILDLLLSLKVSKSDLLSSGIGKIVNFYSRNPKEAVDVRKQASRVAKRWKAQVIREELEE